jgi:lambda family phage portal protein
MSRLSRALRAVVRELRAPQRRDFDAAGGGRRWEGAALINAPVTQGMAAARAIMPRARAEFENNATARNLVEVLAAATIGAGLKPISTRDPALSERHEAWADRADATDLLDLYGLQNLAALAVFRDGEIFIRLETDADDALRLRLIPAEQVDGSLHRELGDGARIVAGVEVDAAGRRVAYHVFPESPDLPFATSITPVRVPADDMLHIFRPTYAGQVRGVSALAPVLAMLRELDKTFDAQVMRQQLGAALAGFIYDQEGGTGGFDGEARGSVMDGGLEPGTLKILPPGTDVKFSNPPTIGADAIEFLRVALRCVAAGGGVTYEQLTGDYSATNYSSARAALIEFRRRIEALQHHVFARMMVRPVWRRWLTLEALAGRVALDGFARDPESWMGAKIITPGWAWVDPEKEIAAEIAAINAGLKSRREVVAGRGYDLRQLDREIAEDAATAPAAPAPEGAV